MEKEDDLTKRRLTLTKALVTEICHDFWAAQIPVKEHWLSHLLAECMELEDEMFMSCKASKALKILNHLLDHRLCRRCIDNSKIGPLKYLEQQFGQVRCRLLLLFSVLRRMCMVKLQLREENHRVLKVRKLVVDSLLNYWVFVCRKMDMVKYEDTNPLELWLTNLHRDGVWREATNSLLFSVLTAIYSNIIHPSGYNMCSTKSQYRDSKHRLTKEAYRDIYEQESVLMGLPKWEFVHRNQEVQTNMPAESVPTLPEESDKRAPVQSDKLAPVESHKRAPVDHDKGAPVDYDNGAPAYHDNGAPVDHDERAPVDHDKEAPVNYDIGQSVTDLGDCSCKEWSRVEIGRILLDLYFEHAPIGSNQYDEPSEPFYANTLMACYLPGDVSIDLGSEPETAQAIAAVTSDCFVQLIPLKFTVLHSYSDSSAPLRRTSPAVKTPTQNMASRRVTPHSLISASSSSADASKELIDKRLNSDTNVCDTTAASHHRGGKFMRELSGDSSSNSNVVQPSAPPAIPCTSSSAPPAIPCTPPSTNSTVGSSNRYLSTETKHGRTLTCTTRSRHAMLSSRALSSQQSHKKASHNSAPSTSQGRMLRSRNRVLSTVKPCPTNQSTGPTLIKESVHKALPAAKGHHMSSRRVLSAPLGVAGSGESSVVRSTVTTRQRVSPRVRVNTQEAVSSRQAQSSRLRRDDGETSGLRHTANGRHASTSTTRQTANGRQASTATTRQTANGRQTSTATTRHTANGRQTFTATTRQVANGRYASTATTRQTANGRQTSTATTRQTVNSRQTSTATTRQTVSSRQASTATTRHTANGRQTSTATTRHTANGRQTSTPNTRQTVNSRQASSPTTRSSLSTSVVFGRGLKWEMADDKKLYDIVSKYTREKEDIDFEEVSNNFESRSAQSVRNRWSILKKRKYYIHRKLRIK